ncbi:tetraacyldisaccharide 4'-kinase [Pontibacter ruber]|uniref:Tetraacyldisaccharide 4'-kinase n=1 Tax=Pontibacter ruber TaxID=1343895 RepID=A0ABW5CRU8_9BACT|nr:tetraacyldisaccharide 4'-kinase [Pontibacter ruber]
MTYLKLLLWPFSLIYGSIMALRNSFYDKGVMHSKQFTLPVIAVGNLTVGGTGKTPHVEYLLRLLHEYKTATLSRGYKRKTRGFILAGSKDSAATLGDEPYQYYTDFPHVTVAVCEDRVKGIENLLELQPELEVVVLDDAMQHRPVQPSLNLLISDYYRPFYHDLVMPAGLLREPKSGARRADAVIMSKCPPDLSNSEKKAILQKIRKYTRAQTPVFYTSYTYGTPVSLGRRQAPGKEIVLLTGIANAKPLVEYLQGAGYTIKQHLEYPDHYAYTSEDLLKLQQLVKGNENISILTTRKDAVKLVTEELRSILYQLPVFYIPIEVRFLDEVEQFDRLILQHVQERSARKV